MELWDVGDPTFSTQLPHRCRRGCHPYTPATLYFPWRFSGTHLCYSLSQPRGRRQQMDTILLSTEDETPFLYIYFLKNFTKLFYIQILYKHTTQKLYICDPQTQLTTSLLFQNLTTGHLQVIFFKILTLLQHIHHFYKYEAIYCFLIYMYTRLRKFKIHNFYIGLHKMDIKEVVSCVCGSHRYSLCVVYLYSICK
jgi:hypothetical protein